MTGSEIFQRRTLIWLISIGVLAFFGAAVVGILAEDPKLSGSSGADSFSRSALGHQALVESLRKSGFVVHQSQSNTADKANDETLVLLIEPSLSDETKLEIKEMLTAGRVLLVLPKRSGLPDPVRRKWLAYTSPMEEKAVKEILDLLGTGAELVRLDHEATWTHDYAAETVKLSDPQLIKWGDMEPIVAAEEGIFVGEIKIKNNPVWVLSDPDILENHLIGEGRNAEFAYQLINAILPDEGSIIVDETAHGHTLNPSLLRAALARPFVFSTLLFLAAAVAALMAGTVRLHSAKPRALEFEQSKQPLIENIADLIQFGGDRAEIVRRYFTHLLRDTSERIHAPAGLRGNDLIAWMDRIGEARGTPTKFSDLRARSFAAVRDDPENTFRLLNLVQEAKRWQEYLIYGTAGRTRH